MTAWMWVQRSLPLVPVLPSLAVLLLLHFRARDKQAGLGSWTRLQLAAFTMLSFGVLSVVTTIANHAITAYGLGG